MINQNDIVLLSYPFSDLKTTKVRPAVVISNNQYNNEFEDMIVVPLTTNLSFRKHVVKLTDKELEKGHLIIESLIKVDRVLSVKQNLVRKTIGKVKQSVLDEIKEILFQLF